MPSKLGFGNNRKTAAPKMKYGSTMHYKNPMPMLGDLDKNGKMSGYESKRQAAIEKNTKPGPPMKYGSPMDMYNKKGSMATFKSDAQRKAAYASGYKGKGK